jgi:hypothetical protein
MQTINPEPEAENSTEDYVPYPIRKIFLDIHQINSLMNKERDKAKKFVKMNLDFFFGQEEESKDESSTETENQLPVHQKD